MAPIHKPAGYTSVSPYLIGDDADRTIAWLVRAVGAQELRHFPDSSGRLMHAEVRITDTVVMLADSADGWRVRDPRGTPWWLASKVA